MDTAVVIEKLKRYKKLLSKQIKFDQLILFGSYTKGTAHVDSDMDVAVIVDEFKLDYYITRPLLWKIRRENKMNFVKVLNPSVVRGDHNP